jgi:tetratricopeptide (TPR) repeat protein
MLRLALRGRAPLRRGLLFACLSFLACSAPAAEAPQSTQGAANTPAERTSGDHGVPDTLRLALLRGEWDAALRALDTLDREQPELADWWQLLRGRTLALAGRHADAASVFEALEKREPASVWRTKAKFARADALRALGQLQLAEEIYEREARRLLSEARQEELAAIYFELADGLSIAPTRATPEAPKLDHQRALALYGKVAALDVAPATRERALWRSAHCLRELSRWEELTNAAQGYRDEFDPERKAHKHAGAHVFEVRELEAQGFAKQGNESRARRAYEDLSAAVAEVRAQAPRWAAWRAASAPQLAALVELDGRAMHARAGTYSSDRSSSLLAVGVLQRLIEIHPEHPLAPRAMSELAERYVVLDRLPDALAAFDRVLAWPAPADAARAAELETLRTSALFRKGELLAAAERLEESATAFKEYVARFPTGSRWTQAQQGLVDLEYNAAQIARRKGEHERARTLWEAFLAHYPLDWRAIDTQPLIAELYVEQAAALREAARKEGRDAVRADLDTLHRAAVEQWRRVVAKYPQLNAASLSLFRIGQVLERELDDLEGAVAAYRECTFGASAEQARAALNEMTLPALELETERVWRTAAAPRVRLRVRNIEKLEVEVFALDLEAYFRKNLAHTDVEQLDLDLISADKVLEFPVEGFERFRRIERDVELPVRGPGVWAVAVSGASLRATTLVISSDLEVLLRNSADEALVFVQEFPSERAAGGARVLLAGRAADDTPSLSEVKTDASGVALSKLGALSDRAPLSVLVLRDGHVATNAFAERSLTAVARPTPRGICYTDRPAYRPGETVRWRAIVRELVDGVLAATPGEEIDLELSDASGRVVWGGRAQLSRFGTAHGEIELDAETALGEHRLRCTTASGALHTGTFQVQRFQPPKARLEFELARAVWMRGERVEGTLRATWSWGEPIASSPLLVALPDGRQLELETDDDGEARVELETRDFAAEQALVLRATLVEEQLTAEAIAYLAAQEFQLALTLPPSALLAGSSFDVRIAARGWEQQPVGAKVRVTVVEQLTSGGTREVQAREVDIAPATGEASFALALDEGAYRIVASAVDRFGNPVEAVGAVEVSGASDARKLRFFVDTHQLEVGRDVALKLMNRSKPGTALVTFEAGKLLSHRIVKLASGVNEVKFTVADEHAPDFVVAAALMGDRELFDDEVQFRAHRALSVEVEARTAQPRPGEELELELRVRDQLGRPVEAELSLAVVDEAFLGLYPDLTAKLAELFPAQRERAAKFATSSSCTFRYVGATRVVASALLAEAERLKELSEWNDKRQQLMDQLGDVAGAPAPQTARVLTGSDDFFLGRGEKGRAAEESDASSAGASGGAAGRFGGKRTLKSRGGMGIAADREDDGSARALAERDLLAHWSPNLVTDAQGRATVRFQLPSSSKRWRCVARGVDLGLLAGEGATDVTAREEFFVKLYAPAELVDGDKPRFLARVHNATGMTGTAKLVLRVEGDSPARVLEQSVQLGADEAVECVFPALENLVAGALRLRLDVEAELSGVARAGTLAAQSNVRPYRVAAADAGRLDVRPWGVELVAARSGVLRDQASFDIALDAAREPRGRVVEIAVGPSVDALLIATALGETPSWRHAPHSHTAAVANELLGVCAALELVQRGAAARAPNLSRLHARAQALAARLSSAQTERGDWTWAAGAGQPHVESTCAALVALATARLHGAVVGGEVLDKGRSALQRAFADAAMQADETKALISWALATVGAGDFGALNRLHRQRASLSPAALAYTALALSEMKLEPMALEVAEELERRSQPFEATDRRPACVFSVEGNSAWLPAHLEMTALAALALESAKPRSARLGEAIDYLLAHRPWYDARARGLCVAAVARFQGESQPAATEARVTVRVAGGEARTIALNPATSGERFSVALADDAPANVNVELRLEGRGAPHFSVELRGFSRKVDAEPGRVRLGDFEFLAAAPRFGGLAIPTGFSVLSEARSTWANRVDEVEFGAVVRGSLSVSRSRASDGRPEQDDYLVAEVPLPAGAKLLAGSARAGGELIEQHGSVLVVHLGRTLGSRRIEFELIGALPGAYRALPAVVRSVYAPGRVNVAAAPPTLKVLARGEAADRSQYRPTPDELFHMGQAQFAAGEREAARELLQRLVDEHEARLRDNVLSEAAKTLLYANIDRKNARDIVRYFEILKEKNPQLYVPFHQVLVVGAAYRELGEHERALTIFRATLEETFGKELRVVDALESEQEFAAAVDVLARTCREYPDAPTVVASSLTLSDKLLKLAQRAKSDAKVRAKGRDRARLVFESVLELQRFLALHPRDPQAPEAGLNLMTAYLALEDYGRAAQLGGELSKCFTEPRFADAFLYSSAVARWYLGEDQAAVGLLERIATAETTDESGRKSASPNRDLALYILGQIHHARREFGLAAGYYERVSQIFADARDTLDALREKHIALPEITRVRPGEKARLELSHRNVADAEVLVYPVDLMTLYLREKNLSSVTAVNLAGIAPKVRRALELGRVDGDTAAKHVIELQLDEPGAYLAICRADERHASGLVLVSTLELDVKEDVQRGRVRVQVSERDGAGKPPYFVRNVDVRVIGSQNPEFVMGATDPRGLFAAEGIWGASTVIARAGERSYAFHRGETPLQPPKRPAAPGGAPASKGDAQYWDNVLQLNDAAQQTRGENWRQEVQRDRIGVQVQQVK